MVNLLPIEQILCPGRQIQLNYAFGGGFPKSCSAQIVKLADEGFLMNVQDAHFLESFRPKGETVIEYHLSSEVKYVCGVYKLHRDEDIPNQITAKPWKVNFALIHKYFNEQVEFPWKTNRTSLRRYFRVEVNLPFYYLTQNTVYIGQVADLSVSGLFTVVNQNNEILQGSPINFCLAFPNKPIMELTGEIVRFQTIDVTKLGLGIHFLNSSKEIQETITNYIWQMKNRAS